MTHAEKISGIFFLLLLMSCESQMQNTPCDIDYCDPDQPIIRTVDEGYGILRQKISGIYFIEVSDGALENNAFFIRCQNPDILLPEINSFVKFSASIQERCTDDFSTENIFLTSIEVLDPILAMNCKRPIEVGAIDKEKVSTDVKISMLHIESNCLQILVRYQGGCNEVPTFRMTSANSYYLSNPPAMDFYLEGEVTADCEQINYQILQYDLLSLYREAGIEELIIDFHQEHQLFHILYKKS